MTCSQLPFYQQYPQIKKDLRVERGVLTDWVGLVAFPGGVCGVPVRTSHHLPVCPGPWCCDHDQIQYRGSYLSCFISISWILSSHFSGKKNNILPDPIPSYIFFTSKLIKSASPLWNIGTFSGSLKRFNNQSLKTNSHLPQFQTFNRIDRAFNKG